MRKTRRRITYVDHRSGTPTEKTKQFHKKPDFDRALGELRSIARTHISELVTMHIYPESNGGLFEQGALP